jgi:hypothetical protein
MTAPSSARSALAYAIIRPDLYRIYPDASKLAGYAGQPDGSPDEITSAAIPTRAGRAWRDSDPGLRWRGRGAPPEPRQ